MPGQPNPETRIRFEDEARKHLQVHGPTNWEPLMAGYLETVSKRTLWRWIKAVQDGEGMTEVIDQESVKGATLAALKHIPAPPAPEYISRAGARAVQNIDFLHALGELYLDCEMLREFSLHKREGGDGRGRIKNPQLFDSSIKRRQDVIQGAIRVLQEIYDVQRQREFYDLIIDEIGKVAPETARAIMERLAELNAKHGLTIHAGGA